MSMELKIIDPSALSQDDRAELDANIESLIAGYKNNRQEINRLVFESVSAMTTGEEYERQLSSKKGLRRFIGGITGSNKAIQDKINSNRAMAQYAAQQTLQRLAEQNLMSFDLITAVNNKLNASVVAIEGEINEVYAALVSFFKQSRSDVIQLENRVERLERNVNLLNWQNSIEYQMFNGVEYAKLGNTAKLICLVRDFYDITKGEWTTSDLLLLKAAMGTIGLSPNQETTYAMFFSDICVDSSLLPKLFDDKDLLFLPHPDDMPIFYGIMKSEQLLQENKGLIGIAIEMLQKHDSSIDRANVLKELVHRDMWRTAQININCEITYFNFAVELLFCLREATQKQLFTCDSKITNLLHQARAGDSKSMFLFAIELLQQGSYGCYRFWGDNIDDAAVLSSNLNNYEITADNVENVNQAIRWLQNAADLGETAAMLAIGDIICSSLPAGAYYWYRQGAIAGSTICMIRLADFLLVSGNRSDIYGVLGTVDYDERGILEAASWYERVAESPGDSYKEYAMLQLGKLYSGDYAWHIKASDEEKTQKSLYWYRKAAEYGGAHAQYELGTRSNKKEAIVWYTKAADQGDADAQYALGKCYEAGHGVVQNFQQAFAWYKRAAEQEYADAQYELARLYSIGRGTEQDWTKSIAWCHKAANQGHNQAQLQLGLFYKDGDRVEQDLPQAVEWFEKASQNGNRDAMCYLGDCYYHGWGVDKDLKRAFRWYEQAADKGDAYAMRRVGDCYYDGEGVWRQNKLEAVQWFLKAANDLDPRAMYLAGLIFIGLHDEEVAEEWLRKAAEQNVTEAEELLKKYFGD